MTPNEQCKVANDDGNLGGKATSGNPRYYRRGVTARSIVTERALLIKPLFVYIRTSGKVVPATQKDLAEVWTLCVRGRFKSWNTLVLFIAFINT